MRSIIKHFPGALPVGRWFREIIRRKVPFIRTLLDFRRTHGHLPNLLRPTGFNEKIIYKRLFDRRNDLVLAADKYAVRDYVRNKLGSDAYLIPLIGAYDDANSIDVSGMPPCFVMKASHGSGWVRVWLERESIDHDELLYLAASWLRRNYGIETGEWVYKNIPPRILIEKLIGPGHRAPDDYKFYCFDGVPRFVHVDRFRFEDHRRDLFDIEWNLIAGTLAYPNSKLPPARPVNFDLMLQIAHTLSRNFDFIRVDLYDTPDGVFFGELTNYPGGGMGRFNPSSLDIEFGRFWTVPFRYRSYGEGGKRGRSPRG